MLYIPLSSRYVGVLVCSFPLLFLSVSQAQEGRHIADPLNISNTYGFGFDADTLKVGGRLGGENQSLAINSNFAGDKWALSYLYVSQPSAVTVSDSWNVSASIDHGKTKTDEGSVSHYQYQLGMIKEYKGWLNTSVYSELAANFLDVDSISNNDSLAIKLSLSVLKPWDPRWYNQFATEITASIDGSERYGGLANIAVGYRLTDLWSWELGYQYQIVRFNGLTNEDTQWLLGVKSQF